MTQASGLRTCCKLSERLVEALKDGCEVDECAKNAVSCASLVNSLIEKDGVDLGDGAKRKALENIYSRVCTFLIDNFPNDAVTEKSVLNFVSVLRLQGKCQYGSKVVASLLKQLDYDSPNLLLSVCTLLVEQKRFGEALPIVQKAVSICRREVEFQGIFPVACYNYAVVLEGNKDYVRAVNEYKNAASFAKLYTPELFKEFYHAYTVAFDANNIRKSRMLGGGPSWKRGRNRTKIQPKPALFSVSDPANVRDEDTATSISKAKKKARQRRLKRNAVNALPVSNPHTQVSRVLEQIADQSIAKVDRPCAMPAVLLKSPDPVDSPQPRSTRAFIGQQTNDLEMLYSGQDTVCDSSESTSSPSTTELTELTPIRTSEPCRDEYIQRQENLAQVVNVSAQRVERKALWVPKLKERFKKYLWAEKDADLCELYRHEGLKAKAFVERIGSNLVRCRVVDSVTQNAKYYTVQLKQAVSNAYRLKSRLWGPIAAKLVGERPLEADAERQ
mmetsp:Transcript_28085/g.45043  ORF Transcript_28085/g.45043 Transcript_28085/m.45043 type:complete len:501 (+) Transcript_28085:789-2291(+)